MLLKIGAHFRIKAMQKNLKNKNTKRRAAPKVHKQVKSRPAPHKKHLKLTQENVKTLQKELALAPKAGVIFTRIQGIFVGGIVLVIIALVFSALIFISNSKTQKSPLDAKLEQAATLTLADEDEVTLLATGDIMLARYVELRMRNLGDYTYPFQKVADFLKSADITFGNLETPFLPGRNVPKDSMTFRADLSGVKGLQAAGYDVISVANNHTMNYQVPGLTSTLQELKKAGILYAGGGKNFDAAHAPAVVEAKGRRIAFLAYNDQSIPPRFHGEAKPNFPGIAKMDIKAVKNDVKKSLEQADVVVVSMHAGKEYTREPTQFQKDFAHAAIDAGASVVIGHHPHWVQGMEEYGNGLIFYSLGNFVFDQFFSEDVQTGLIARITFKEDGGLDYELLPVRVEKTQPRILEGEEKVAVMARLGL